MFYFWFLVFQIKEKFLFKTEAFAEILATIENVTIKVTYEFNTFNATELIENINYDYDMNLTTIGNLSLLSDPEMIIFESTGKALYIHFWNTCTHVVTNIIITSIRKNWNY